MKGKGFTDEQIRERYTDVCRQIGVSEASFYLWKKKKYAKFERSTTAPPAGLVTELQAIEDFITTSAGQLDVTEVADVSVVVMIDDQAEFERAYPQARTKRDGVVYPRRVHRVAAARRAHSLEAAGASVRIAVAS